MQLSHTQLDEKAEMNSKSLPNSSSHKHISQNYPASALICCTCAYIHSSPVQWKWWLATFLLGALAVWPPNKVVWIICLNVGWFTAWVTVWLFSFQMFSVQIIPNNPLKKVSVRLDLTWDTWRQKAEETLLGDSWIWKKCFGALPNCCE